MKYQITVINHKIGYKQTFTDLTLEEVRIVAERHSDKEVYRFMINQHETPVERKAYKEHQRKLIEGMTARILLTTQN